MILLYRAGSTSHYKWRKMHNIRNNTYECRLEFHEKSVNGFRRCLEQCCCNDGT